MTSDAWASVEMAIGHRSALRGRFECGKTGHLAMGGFVVGCDGCGHLGGCEGGGCRCPGGGSVKCSECSLAVIGFALDEPDFGTVARAVLLQGIVLMPGITKAAGDVVYVDRYGIVVDCGGIPAAFVVGKLMGETQAVLLT
jgi:hypothetical protein